MSRLAVTLLVAGLLGALGAAPASGPASFASKKHALITFDNDGVYPPVLTIGPDEVVGWLNYSDATAQIVFPDNVADAFTCSGVRPSFYRIGGGRLASRPIGTLEFAMPCQLDPGTYHYGLILSYGTGGILSNMASQGGELPQFDFKGEIRVK